MTGTVQCRRRILAAAAAVMVASTFAATPAVGQSHHARILFTQEDAVQAFDLATGRGYQIGTAKGAISATTFVEFQFAPAEPPTSDPFKITFTNKVTVTDLDGDQIFFDNDGTGTFHLGTPGSDFSGSGGPLTGTYVVMGGTGKFADWKVGTVFTYRAIVTHPPSPPGALGNVLVEISYHDKGKR